MTSRYAGNRVSLTIGVFGIGSLSGVQHDVHYFPSRSIRNIQVRLNINILVVTMNGVLT